MMPSAREKKLVADNFVPHASGVRIRELQPGEDATVFRALNGEWIARFLALEASDRA